MGQALSLALQDDRDGLSEIISDITGNYDLTRFYDSFRSVVGFTFGYNISPYFAFAVRGDYYHEFADTDVTLDSRMKSLPFALTATGQDTGRESGRFGASFSWLPSEHASIMAGYDFTAARKYQGHDFTLQARVEF